jgi:CarD family transcriptional regulator
VNDIPRSFYHLILLDGSGGELFVPVDKVQTIGIRPLLERSDIPKLFDQLTKKNGIPRDWKQRANDNLKLFSSGSAFDLAKIVESLTDLRETKELTLREKWILDKARKLLVSEISEVIGETTRAVDDHLDQALEARKSALPVSLPLPSHLT